MMRSLRFSVLAIALGCMPALVNAQVGVAINATGAAPNARAILDVASISSGLLIPRMTQAERAGIVAPAEGLWVYQTDVVVGEPSGFWYFDADCACPGAAWVHMATGFGWRATGNTALVAGNYLGTSDATDFVWRTNGAEGMRILSTGEIGINTAIPTEAVEVDGAVKLFSPGSDNITNQQGGIRFNTAPPAGYPTVHEGNTNNALTGWDRLENVWLTRLNENYEGSIDQCGTGSAECGVSNGVSTSNVNTPFPTGTTAATQGRGCRVQYIFRPNELTACGLCPGQVTEIAFKVIDDDITGPNPPSTAAAFNIEVRMRNGGAVNALPAYDQPIMLTAPVYTANNVVMSSGFYTMPVVGFNWIAGNSIIIEVSYIKNNVIGASPRVELTTGLGYNATRYGYHNTGQNGNTFNDAPLNPATGTFGTRTDRPVVRFTGQALVPTPTLLQDDYIIYNGGVTISTTPAWALANYKGPGVLIGENGVYDGTSQLSDHVFDTYFDGLPRPEDKQASANYVWTDLDDLKEKLRTERHLPNMPSREEWERKGGAPLGELHTGLWRTVEDQALYISELHEELSTLEDLAFASGLTDAQLGALIQDIRQNERLSTEQKTHLIEAFQQRHANPANTPTK